MQTMNRVRVELLTVISATTPQLEQLERDASRLRWRADVECDVLLARMDAAVIRRELTR